MIIDELDCRDSLTAFTCTSFIYRLSSSRVNLNVSCVLIWAPESWLVNATLPIYEMVIRVCLPWNKALSSDNMPLSSNVNRLSGPSTYIEANGSRSPFLSETMKVMRLSGTSACAESPPISSMVPSKKDRIHLL